VREVVSHYSLTALSSSTAGHGGVFRGSELVLRIEDPACLLAVRRSSGDSWTTVLVLPLSGDREAIDRLRTTLENRVLPAV
jgi:hypothetical protein